MPRSRSCVDGITDRLISRDLFRLFVLFCCRVVLCRLVRWFCTCDDAVEHVI